MATDKKNKEDRFMTDHKRTLVWEKMTIDEWTSHATQGLPNNNWEVVGGRIKGCCPWHAEEHPSFYIDVNKHHARCMGATCPTRFSDDPLYIISSLRRISYEESLDLVSSFHGLNLIPKRNRDEFEKGKRSDDLLKEYYNICHNELIQAATRYSDDAEKTSEFAYAYPAIHYLQKTRGIDFLPNLTPVGVIPPERRVASYFEGRDEEFNDLISIISKVKDVQWIGALAFPYYYSGTKVAMIKARQFAAEVGGVKAIIAVTNPSYAAILDEACFYGVESMKGMIGAGSSVYLVEGEFDFLSLYQTHLMEATAPKFMLAIGGSAFTKNTFHVLSKSYAVRHAFMLMDHPLSQGDALIYRAIKESSGEVEMYAYKWESPLSGNDPDEVIQRAEDKKDAYNTLLHPRNYFMGEEIIKKMVEADMLKQCEAGAPRSPAFIIRNISASLTLVNDHILRSTSIRMLAKEYKVDEQELTSMLRPQEEGQESFYQRTASVFGQHYAILGSINNSTKTETDLIIWNYINKKEKRVSCTKAKETQSVLAEDLGALTTFFKTHVGIPLFIDHKTTENPEGRAITDIEKELERVLSIVIKEKMKNVPTLTPDKELRNGIFWVDEFVPEDEDDPHGPKKFNGKCWYIQNGKKVYKGVFEYNKLIWRDINVPVSDGFHFDMSSDSSIAPWSTSIENLKSFEKETLPIKTIYTSLLKIMKGCFHFKYEVDYYSAAAACMYFNIFPIFDRNILLHVEGETSTGKTKLVFGLFGGMKRTDTSLVESMMSLPSATEAGMRQSLKGIGLPCALDEFEDMGGTDSHSKNTRKILTTLRTAMEPGNRVVKGTPHGKAIEFELSLPFVTTGIRSHQEEADANRFVYITTERKVGFLDPMSLMKKMTTKEERKTLREAISLGLFKHAHDILGMQQTLEEAMLSSTNVSWGGIPSRLLKSLTQYASIIATAMGDVQAGMDYLTLFKQDRSSHIESNNTAGLTGNLWDRIFRNQVFEIRNASETDQLVKLYSIHDLMRSSSHRTKIMDEYVKGLRLYSTQEPNPQDRSFYLFVSWDEARSIFKVGDEFKNYNVSRLKSIADRDIRVASAKTVSTLPGVDAYLRYNNGLTNMSVIHITALVNGDISISEAFAPTDTIPDFVRNAASMDGPDFPDDIEDIEDSEEIDAINTIEEERNPLEYITPTEGEKSNGGFFG
jgi:DNA primase